jgi:ATP-binding cassette, subfamily A (ABC1), member 3
VATNPEAVYRLIGYCPQFDALFDNMTAREHLQLYARIKGIPNNLLNEAVTQKLQEMDLTYYADKLAGGFRYTYIHTCTILLIHTCTQQQ